MANELFNIIWPILGASGFVFRLWLTHFKLKDELQFRKDYVSRYIALYFFLAMTLGFKNEVFNLIICAALPVMLVSFIGWDSLFFVKFKKRTYWEKNHAWLIVERITMHPPVIAVSLYWWIIDLKGIIGLTNGIITIIAACILVMGPYMIWDKRWTEKYIAPTGMNIFIFMIISVVGLSIYLLAF